MPSRASIERRADLLHATAEGLALLLRSRTEGPSWWIAVLREAAVRLEHPGRHGRGRDEEPEGYVNAELQRARKPRYRLLGPIPDV